MELRLETENMLEGAVGPEHGLSRAEIDALAVRIEESARWIEERRGHDIGFMELPYDEALAKRIRHKAEELRGWCKNFVVLGIGGSALGNIALHTALNHPYHNLLAADHPARAGAPAIFVLDNIDPRGISGFMDLIGDEVTETAFNVITKSGSTAETMSQFLFVRDTLRRTRGAEPSRQIIVTTDPNPQKSLLRRIAEREGYCAFPIPDNIGGRFSVLSAVGLLSAAVGGIAIEEVLSGGRRMDAACRRKGLWDNPAALYASMLYLQYRRGKNICVLMPYSEALRGLALWFCQLWAESLGKRDGLTEKDIFVGPTPVPSVGVTDQHSVMQLYQDGPFDKVITLIEVERLLGKPIGICQGEAEEELDYLASHSFDDLFGAEQRATRCALTEKSRPNCTLRIPEVSPSALGELFMFFEYAVTYSGSLYGVNAFDQPGVELGKRYTYGLMGREGYEPPAGA